MPYDLLCGYAAVKVTSGLCLSSLKAADHYDPDGFLISLIQQAIMAAEKAWPWDRHPHLATVTVPSVLGRFISARTKMLSCFQPLT